MLRDINFLITSSRIKDASADDLKQAVTEADTAGGSDPKYRQQACLARIRRGLGKTTADEDRTRCNTIQEAGDFLVRGMYHLRQAQNLITNQVAWSAELANAMNDFDAGLVLAQATQTTTPKPAPGAPDIDASRVPVTTLLEFGHEISAFCNRSPAHFEKFQDKQQIAIDYFGRYKVYSCEKN